MLHVLLRSFRFGLSTRPEEITMQAGLILRPYVHAELKKGPQVPLTVHAL